MKRGQSSFLDRTNILAFIVMLALAAVSLLAQSNANYYAGGDYYQRQVIWIVIGGAVFFGAAIIDLRLIERAAYMFYAVCVALLVLTLLIGTAEEQMEFKRWIHLGAFNIQASEFAKLGTILALARYIHADKERLPGEGQPDPSPYDLRDLLKPAAIVMLPMPLILLQPDLGTALMLIFVAATMLLIEGVRRRAIIVSVLSLLVVIPVAWKTGLIQEYQKDRIYKLVDQTWEKVDEETGMIIETRTTQVEQAIWAIGSGGFLGQGNRGANKARLGKLPELHNDFVAPLVAEERGFIGMVALLFLFWIMVMWALRTAQDSRSHFCRLVAVGIASLFGWQVFINIGMVTGMLPVVGLPLPFLSYGGSSLIMWMLSLGILFNIAVKRGRM
ncbi:MAG: rod shape-determining protein RodA [Myxococcales bacterium]|nr:rod shape-determining protein RodA [Myxococcales bacterium]MCB9736754.1 rod shape-determining protein RodA [Deltaproteobacteria bacterium]